jgi:hypothetical protein
MARRAAAIPVNEPGGAFLEQPLASRQALRTLSPSSPADSPTASNPVICS